MKAQMTALAAVLLGTMAGFAGEEVKVGSPFDLKLGRDELAVRHPKLPSRSYSVFYDDPHLDAGRAWTELNGDRPGLVSCDAKDRGERRC